MNKHYKLAKEEMINRGKTLTCSDFIGKGYLKVKHDDGTEFKFKNYLAEIKFNEFLIVYTEHCGYHIFALDEIKVY